ncbi:hypothetical protein MMC25_006054 [Agyrium rufum]|nr:hypothetical protein [Agyrium rufum]
MTSEAPPQLGDIPQHSEFNVPTLSSTSNSNSKNSNPFIGGNSSNTSAPMSSSNTNGAAQVDSAKNTVYNILNNRSRDHLAQLLNTSTTEASTAMDSINNHPMTQNVKDTVANVPTQLPQLQTHRTSSSLQILQTGPVAENVKDQHAKTTAEFRSLADSRTVPDQSAATGQPLTHYHSFFYNLLSWENPRATSIAFATTIGFIFAARYLPALRWTFKALYIVLGITAAAEVAGKLVLSQGLTSSFRPKRYYTIPRETLEASLEDVEQLINFFVIEFQRVLFAENPAMTIAAFAASLVSYWLIKFTPLWGLSLIATSVLYLTPLIYKTNKDLIDHHVSNATNVVNAQATQVKDLAGHHTARATSTISTYAGDYSAKAQEYIGTAARGNKSTSGAVPTKSGPGSGTYKDEDFPHAPKQEPTPGATSHEEQYQNSQFGGSAPVAS